MIRRLKFRRPSDALPNQTRARRQFMARWLYLGAVLGLLGWLGDLFFGGFFYLRSDGLVVGEPAVIAAEFPVTVRDILVREGQHIKAGDVAATVSSQHVAETIARLSGEQSAREARLSELRIRGQTVDSIIGYAENRQRIASGARKDMESLMDRGYLPLDKRTAAVESEFRSRQDVEGLRAEKRVVESETAVMQNALIEARAAIDELRRLYDEGRMRAPIDGIVGRLIANKGAVVPAGQPMAEIYGEERFVLAYLSTEGPRYVAEGDLVRIRSGLHTARGRVTRIEPIAAVLPREFQRAFAPVDRQQVIRIDFMPDEVAPPLFTKVQLRSANSVPQWAVALFTRIAALIRTSASPDTPNDGHDYGSNDMPRPSGQRLG